MLRKNIVLTNFKRPIQHMYMTHLANKPIGTYYTFLRPCTNFRG